MNEINHYFAITESTEPSVEEIFFYACCEAWRELAVDIMNIAVLLLTKLDLESLFKYLVFNPKDMPLRHLK